MAKAKTAYVCTECGAEHSKWQGQCVECGVWNTLSAIVLTPASTTNASMNAQRSNYAGNAAGAARITSLTAVALTTEARTLTANWIGCSVVVWCRARWC
jgi:DNA repair protein RadA/Sms